VDGCDVVVAYGAIGAKPRGSRKTMESAAKAKAEMTKSINAKTKKGYVAAGSSTAAVASPRTTILAPPLRHIQPLLLHAGRTAWPHPVALLPERAAPSCP